MKNKQHISLTEENFNRIKKNIAKHINKEKKIISQSDLSEAFSKSIGFSNYHHAQSENFKTDKFEHLIQKKYPGIKGIVDHLRRLKIESENILLFNPDKNSVNRDFMSNINNFVFTDVLYSKNLILNDLCNYLHIEKEYGIKFDLKLWLKCLNDEGLFDDLYIKLKENRLFNDIIIYLKEQSPNFLEIFIERLIEYYLTDEKLEQEDINLKLLNIHYISLEYTGLILSSNINENFKIKIIELILLDYLSNFGAMEEEKRKDFNFFIMRIKQFGIQEHFSYLDDCADYKKKDQIIDHILSFKDSEEIKECYIMLMLLRNNVKSDIFIKDIFSSIFQKINKKYSYLRSINEVNQFMLAIEKN